MKKFNCYVFVNKSYKRFICNVAQMAKMRSFDQIVNKLLCEMFTNNTQNYVQFYILHPIVNELLTNLTKGLTNCVQILINADKR